MTKRKTKTKKPKLLDDQDMDVQLIEPVVEKSVKIVVDTIAEVDDDEERCSLPTRHTQSQMLARLAVDNQHIVLVKVRY